MLNLHYGDITAIRRPILSGLRKYTFHLTQKEFLSKMTGRRRKPALDVPRTIVFVGLMGAGKSHIGRRLAARLGLPFIDADAEIEAAAGCSIEEIFARHGEDAFRDGERRVIARLLSGPVHVMAAGGGAFMNAETRRRIRDCAISIWLRAEVDVLLERVARRSNRPLLKQGDPRQVLEQLIAERYPVYGEADITVDTNHGPPGPIADKVYTALKEHISRMQAEPKLTQDTNE